MSDEPSPAGRIQGGHAAVGRIHRQSLLGGGVQHACEQCGATFRARRHAKFCSDACRTSAWRERTTHSH